MDTKAHAGWRNMCLAVCGVLIALAAHTTQGIPVLQRITPTARLPYKPSTPIPAYRKSFRSWAKKQHENLWMGAPSGDGPTDEWYSSHTSSHGLHLLQSTTDDYTTRSPTPEDIFPSQSDPFPTVIDTTVETSEVYSDEVLSRNSEAFEGPSSLLNTFIFRPSGSEESPSGISPTPSLETSSVSDQTAFYLSASWTDMDELVSTFSMSSRRALSDIPSEIYAIITAISATHIYGDDFLPLPSDPSNFNLFFSASSLKERVPETGSSTILSTITTSTSVHLPSSLHEERPEFSNYTLSVSNEQPFSVLSSPISLPIDILPQNISDSIIKSAFASEIFSSNSSGGHPAIFTEATFIHWSPLVTSNELLMSSLNTAMDYFNDISIDSSFSNSIHFLSPSDIFPVLSTYETILLSTVDTTVTIINKETPYTFIRPTLTVSGTSYNKTIQNVSKYVDHLGSSLYSSVRDDFSSFKHLSSTFNTESIQLLSTKDKFNLLTRLSDSPTDIFSAATSIFSVLKSNEILQNGQEQSTISTESVLIENTNTPFTDKLNDILTSSRLSNPSSLLFQTTVDSVFSIETTSIVYSETENLSNQANGKQTLYNEINMDSSKNEIQPQLTSKSKTKEATFETTSVSSKVASQISDFETITSFKEVFPSIKISFDVQKETNAYSTTLNSNESLSKGNIYPTHELENEIVSSTEKLRDETEWDTIMYSLPNTNLTLLTPRPSKSEYFVTSTHHVTYRSLRDTLSFDYSEYEVTEEIPTKTIKTFLLSSEPTDFSSGDFTTQTLLYPSSESSIIETMVFPSIPQTSLITDISTIINHSKPINSDLNASLESSILSKNYSMELSLKFTPSSTLGEMVPLFSSMYSSEATNEDFYESFLFHSSSKFAQEISSLVDQLPTPSLDSIKSLDINDTMSESPSLPVSPLTSADYQIISTTVSDDYSYNFSDFNNYFLESSNISSKSVEEQIFQSPVMNGSAKLDYLSSVEDRILSSSEKFESSFGGFLMSFEEAPIISPTMSFHESSEESDTFNIHTISETSLVFPDSATLDDQSKQVITPLPSDYHESNLYISYTTYISNDDVSSNFFVEITPSFGSYVISSSFSVDTLYPGQQTENVSCIFYSIPYIVPYSVITTTISQNIDHKSVVSSNSMDITHHSIVSDTSIQTPTQTISPNEISILSSNIQNSFSKIDALDLSVFTDELPFSTLEYISMPDEQSTMFKQPRSIESYYPKYEVSSEFQGNSFLRYDSYFPASSEETISTHLLIDNSQRINSKDFDSEGSIPIPLDTRNIPNPTTVILESQMIVSSKSKETFSEGSIDTKISASLTTSMLMNYDATSPIVNTLLTLLSSQEKEPQSIESNKPVRKPSSFIFSPSFTSSPFLPSSPSSYKEPKSVESDFPKTPTPSLSVYSFSNSTKLLHETSTSNGKEPESIESDHPKPKSTIFATPLLSSSYASLSSLKSPHQPLLSFSKVQEPKSIESEYPKSRHFHSLELVPVVPTSSKPLISPVHSKPADSPSIESGHSKLLTSSSMHTPFITNQFLSMKPQFGISSASWNHQFHPSSMKQSMSTFSSMFSSADLRPTWSEHDTSTPDETVLLPVSSHLNVNHTRNSSSGESSHTNEKSQIDESLSTSGDQGTPTDRTILFKDNHYWVLTVLEAPVKGHLPENFSHSMELRLSNAYSEAFRLRAARNNETRGGQDMIVVKILSLTEDLLRRQLEIVYVVERGGVLVPASVASEYLSSLRFEQLREFLGHHVIVKARPYQPREGGSGQPVGSPVPVLAIVGGVLGSLLFLFCCFCIYCRCCRPKPLPSTPDSSTSGSLQRSLSKYGQHNRKHLFREMTHQLTTEMAAQMKQGSSAPDTYLAEKRAGRSLPTLPREGSREEDLDASMKILKILENKDASTSPVTGRSSRGAELENETSSSEKMKKTPKPKRRRKIKDSHGQHTQEQHSLCFSALRNNSDSSQPESPPPTPPPKIDVSIPTAESRQSPDSGTSSREPPSQPSSPSDKSATETESEGSHAELLPPTQHQTDRSEHEGPSAAVETQIHLSRVRQRIAELLDDAFALAGGRKLYGSLRSKKVEPSQDIFPRFGSFRSQSATGADYTFRHPGSGIPLERRPMTEGGQRLMGVITDEGQLITHPPPKLVWDQDEGASVHEVIEARNLNLFPFHQHPTSRQHIPTLPSSLEALPESCQHEAAALEATLREAASELQLARSARMNPAVVGQYDEIDVVSALRNGEPVEALIKAIKDELMRFSGSFPGEGDSESHA